MDRLKIAGLTLFVAFAEFVIGLTISEALRSGYSVSSNYISDLGVGSSSIIFNTSVFLLGLLVLVGAYCLQRALNCRVLTIFLALTGVGAMGVGVFNEDFGVIHTIMSLITFLFGGLSAIASFRVVKFPFSAVAMLLGLTGISALCLFGVGADLGLGRGGMERMIAYPLLIWGGGFGGCLMSGVNVPEK